ncbi:MAG: tetratricopeptide repeat protein [Candidatus Thorarchaeota archaeon]
MNEPSISTFDGQTEKEWIDTGNTFYNAKEYEQARRCFEKALRINPDNPKLWNKQGTIYFELGEYENAISCYDTALEDEPFNEVIISNKAFAYHYLGQFEEALKLLDISLKKDPNNPVTWCNKGSALFDLNRFEEAIECYDSALKIDPEYKIAHERKLKATERFKHQKVQILEQNQNYEKAADFYEEIEQWADAGRCRELNRKQKLKEKGEQQTKFRDSITNSIQDSVVIKSGINGIKEKKIFRICPYCGEKMDFAEPPRFCPYCAKQIVK